MRFDEGDEVIVVDGPYKGDYGVVTEYFLGMPLVDLTENQTGQVVVMLSENVLEALPPEETEDTVLNIPVHGFGISAQVLERHLEYLIGRSLIHVGKVGAKEALFGYQEFEGKSASEVLLELMLKLEEGMAMFAQAHILIGRIVTALEDIHDSDQ